MANIRKTFNFREGVKVDDNVLVVAGERVGIGTTVPSQVLDVRGRVTITGDVDYSNSVTTGISTFAEVRLGTGVTISSLSGIITATSFYGDGSNLTNITATSGGTIGIQSGTTYIGSGITALGISGSNSSLTISAPSSGFSTITLPAPGVSLGLAIALGG